VASDVVLPDAYTYIDIGEKELDNHLPWDEIEPARYFRTSSVTNLDNIKKKSKMRVAKLESFALMEEKARRLEKQQDQTVISLSLKKFREELAILDEESKKYKDIQKDSTGLTITQIPIDLEAMEGDSAKMALADAWHEKLSRDIYLFEATEVLKDMYFSNTGVLPEDK
jgi:carboxyl-terminal processing protease